MTRLATPLRSDPALPAPQRARTLPGWAAVVLLLVVSAVALGAGGGLGIRYAQKTGVSTTTVVGFAVLTVGLLLLAAGARRMWRGLHRWWRLLVVPVVLAVLLPATSVGLAVAATQVPPTRLDAQTPADVGLSFEEVSYSAEDGARLSAWLLPSRNGAAVVLRHGAGSTRSGALRQAVVLARNGFGVLVTDARGHGRSGGTGMDLGWSGDADVEASVAYLQDRLELDRRSIGLVGLSMGGEEVVGAAPVTGVPAVVAEGATARTAEDKDQWLPGGVAGTVQRGLDRLTFALTELLADAARPAPLHEAVRSAHGARFLLVSAGEVPDEAKAAAVLRDAAPSRVETWDVPGAAHTGGLAEDPDGWEQRVVGFLEQQLLGAGRSDGTR